MAFTEQQEYKLEILPNKVIQVRRSDIVLKDGEVVGTTYHRHCVCPGDDVSTEPAMSSLRNSSVDFRGSNSLRRLSRYR